jgi:hypothetical protein
MHRGSARKLLIQYGVQYGVAEGPRTLDSLTIVPAFRQLGQVDVLVAANQRHCQVASMAGCAVNPEKPGPVFA